MINYTKEVCLLENWTHDISMNDENLEQQLLLQDPYDSIWLKIISILSYFISLITSVIMLAFINYENKHHGNFRTVINQLLSNLYAMVSKHFILLDNPEICIIFFMIKIKLCILFNLLGNNIHLSTFLVVNFTKVKMLVVNLYSIIYSQKTPSNTCHTVII